jgi:hypothetical protein
MKAHQESQLKEPTPLQLFERIRLQIVFKMIENFADFRHNNSAGFARFASKNMSSCRVTRSKAPQIVGKVRSSGKFFSSCSPNSRSFQKTAIESQKIARKPLKFQLFLTSSFQVSTNFSTLFDYFYHSRPFFCAFNFIVKFKLELHHNFRRFLGFSHRSLQFPSKFPHKSHLKLSLQLKILSPQ